jgi:uncharacterized protein (TIGR02996 family)
MTRPGQLKYKVGQRRHAVVDDTGFIRTIQADPEDATSRLVYADWLEEHSHPGGDYLRAEVALSRAGADEAPAIRRSLLELIPRLPVCWRDRFEQPDVLLAPPVPFRQGWYPAKATAALPYRSLPNLELEGLSPDLPWLSGEGTEPRLDQAEHEQEEFAALAEVQRRAARLGLILPPGFESFAQDFPRRGAVSAADTYFDVCLHDAVVYDFPRVDEGYLVVFFADMNYGNPHQRMWSLYLVPKIAWHCVVAYELPDDDPERPPDDPEQLLYCAPSFEAFLYRWWLEGRSRSRRPRRRLS